jgi:hypothetical protein
MSDHIPDRTAPAEKTPGQTARTKKPYQKPSFQHERVFETMALICGKLDPTLSQCQVNRKTS